MTARPPTDQAQLARLLASPDVVAVARGLLGCRLTLAGGSDCTIVETEAYHESEPACHGYLGRTARAGRLRRPPGIAYVYLSYGIHHLVNVVCGPQEVASAVLIRGVEARPDGGGELIGTPGPGRVGRLLGAALEHDGRSLLSGELPWTLVPACAESAPRTIRVGPRIGITKAIDLPWRCWLEGSPGVSRPS